MKVAELVAVPGVVTAIFPVFAPAGAFAFALCYQYSENIDFRPKPGYLLCPRGGRATPPWLGVKCAVFFVLPGDRFARALERRGICRP